MEFNLLELHDSVEDKNNRELLRVYSVVPRFATALATEAQLAQAVKVNTFLREVNEKLKKEIALNWKNAWLKSLGYAFSKSSCKDWFYGRASIPLITLKKLGKYGFQEEVQKLVDKAEFFCSTTGKVFKVPHELDSNLAYLLGAILGDGHLKKAEHTIRFEVSDKCLAKKFVEKIKLVFGHEVVLHERRHKGTMFFGVNVNNKPAFRFFNKMLGVPRGKKSDIIRIPPVIMKASNEVKLGFLEGIFETDGCLRRNGFRLTTASLRFRNDLCALLESLGENGRVDEWVNKKYNKKYYGLQYSIRNLSFLHG